MRSIPGRELARSSHKLPAAGGEQPLIAAFLPASSWSIAHTGRYLRALATKVREKCGFVLLLLLLLLVPVSGWAKLAVFVDGRILKVTDAVAEGDRIRLELPSGGTLIVPATRVDRVVEDEVPEPGHETALPRVACDPRWRPEPLPRGTPYAAEIEAAARKANLHPWLLAALVQAESAFDPYALSRVGAAGLTQLMPAAAADHGVENVWNVRENLRGGASHLRMLLDRFGDLRLALAAYNAGAATVDRYHGVPPYRETRGFVRRILRIFCPDGSHGQARSRFDEERTGRS